MEVELALAGGSGKPGWPFERMHCANASDFW